MAVVISPIDQPLTLDSTMPAFEPTPDRVVDAIDLDEIVFQIWNLGVVSSGEVTIKFQTSMQNDNNSSWIPCADNLTLTDANLGPGHKVTVPGTDPADNYVLYRYFRVTAGLDTGTSVTFTVKGLGRKKSF